MTTLRRIRKTRENQYILKTQFNKGFFFDRIFIIQSYFSSCDKLFIYFLFSLMLYHLILSWQHYFSAIIISILFSCSSYCGLVFSPIFCCISRGNPNGNKYLSEFFRLSQPSEIQWYYGVAVSICSNFYYLQLFLSLRLSMNLYISFIMDGIHTYIHTYIHT